ncbi:unnamed protein product [Sphenostylis stenocarpa]|uniref:Uncharacterized protein n=1 Tax=Sphenostylis stenocarpa TaxID=92480 RepID=A0AA86VDP9_9FABA|nr:unnamed protein product [Sphenostylis stenocarpa]
MLTRDAIVQLMWPSEVVGNRRSYCFRNITGQKKTGQEDGDTYQYPNIDSNSSHAKAMDPLPTIRQICRQKSYKKSLENISRVSRSFLSGIFPTQQAYCRIKSRKELLITSTLSDLKAKSNKGITVFHGHCHKFLLLNAQKHAIQCKWPEKQSNRREEDVSQILASCSRFYC